MRFALTHPLARPPVRGTRYSAAFDLYAVEHTTIYPAMTHGFTTIKTGLKIELPPNTFGLIACRSGLAKKHGIITGAGVIDEDYRGEVMVLAATLAAPAHTISAGERCAQLLILPRYTGELMQITEDMLTDTPRGAGGFGSTGR